MADSDFSTPTKIDGRSTIGFLLASPDLVICMGSPDVPIPSYELSPEISQVDKIDVSLENGIMGTEIKESLERPIRNEEEIYTDSSFDLFSSPFLEQNSTKHYTHVMSTNVGSKESIALQGIVQFSEDCCFSGGDIVRTKDPINGDGEGLNLYQKARIGNFPYLFEALEFGTYMFVLYFAEIVLTDGP